MNDISYLSKACLCNVWTKEYSQVGKCHFHVCLVFNEQAYNRLGSYNTDTSLRVMITRAWYCALSIEEEEDSPGLVLCPENCRYILDQSSADYIYEYGELVHRLDYLTKPDSKIYEEGEGTSAVAGSDPPKRPSLRGKAFFKSGIGKIAGNEHRPQEPIAQLIAET